VACIRAKSGFCRPERDVMYGMSGGVVGRDLDKVPE
jgi:hypothetical protein